MSDIRAYVMQHELFNHHDHQQGYTEIEQGRDGYDFTSLFGYADADLACAAGTDVDVKAISRQELATLWQAIRLTGYGRAVDLGSRALFGIPFTPDRWDEITAALRGWQARAVPRSMPICSPRRRSSGRSMTATGCRLRVGPPQCRAFRPAIGQHGAWMSFSQQSI